MAVGFITFREGNGIASAVLIVVAFALQLLHAIHMAGGLSYLNVTNGLFMIAIIVFAGLLGLLLSMMMRRQQTREQAHERMLERQEQHAQTLDYAAQVHDRISGRLASISMICSKHIGERNAVDADSRDAEDWRLVASQVADSLADAYSIIELMSGIQWRGSTTRADTVSVDRLRRLCDALREELAGKGFHGGFALHDNGLMEDIDPDHMTLLGEPLNEIAHNIIRHCPAGCEFDCSVMLHDDVAEVTQYNSVTHPADKSETAVSTHMGLGLYRDRLLHIGGMLRTEVEDGTWMLYARVPLTHQT